MSRSVTLSTAQTPWVVNKTSGVRVRMQVASAVNIPTELFAYYVVPGQAGGVPIEAKFSHVCTPQDLVSIASGLPASTDVIFFRLPYIDLFLRSPEEAAELISLVKSDIAELKHTLEVMSQLPPSESVTI